MTIAKGPGGGYIVYSGDEPDDTDAGSDDTGGGAGAAAGGMGAGGAGMAAGGMAAGGASGGQQVSSIGAALKAALDILNEDASSAGGAGSSASQFEAGYNGTATPPAPAGRGGLKYPPTAG